MIAGNPLPDAAAAFAARYRLAEFALAAGETMKAVDALMVPTAPRPVTLSEMAADPVGANSMLGRYTNFVNLLDLCALAVPASLTGDGTAAGVTLIAPVGRDAALAGLGRAFHAASGLPLGATGLPMPAAAGLAGPGEARRDRDRGGRRPSVGHAAQWRTDGSRRQLRPRDDDDGGLSPLRPAGRAADAAGPGARRGGRRRDRA